MTHARACVALIVISLALHVGIAPSAFASHAVAPTMTVYLPNVTRMLGGPTGWQTPFIVQNVGTANTDLHIDFYGFADGGLVKTRTVNSLRPGTSIFHDPNSDTGLAQGGQYSVVIRSYGARVVSVVNQHNGTGVRAEALSYVGLSGGTTTVHLPYVAKNALGWLTTLIFQNVGTATTTATAVFRNLASGTGLSPTLTRTIAPGRSAFVDPRFEAGLQDGVEYAVTVTSTQPLAVVTNAHNDAATVPDPKGFSYNGVGRPADTTYLAYVKKEPLEAQGPGRAKIYLQNAGTTDATPTLTFHRIGVAATVTIQAPAAIAPGAGWAFDPQIFKVAGGYQLCANAPPGSCIAPGEHSLVVTGGQFAVLNAQIVGPTALGFTGTDVASSRVYMPNVTRSLGGPAGWTTPLVVQSGGATAATVRWYRFSDGTLANTQSIATLSAGRSVLIDPRTVPGLVDDAQYAVVVEGVGGNVTGIVLEYAQGGDNAMAYEAFPFVAAAAPAATDPNAYFRPLGGYTYVALPDTLLSQLRGLFTSAAGITGVAGRSVTQGGVSAGLVLVLAIDPAYAALPGWDTSLLESVRQGAAPSPTETFTLAGRTVVFVDTPEALDYMAWAHGSFMVIVYGTSRPAMTQLGSALITANN